ncbi:MerR family DNA-binding transcriptional regulator [Pelagibius sp.]|uniref:MerR family transcriptional regulator n=1 Tax=Pelagibius sp. TaxID=1931238 RepID=UPI0026287E85|nr:MerR family DNA-binding transcriptional regulator [Pelagibius sp.]
MTKLYSVTELAQELDVTPRALRFYEDKGLIAPQRAGKTRVYTHRDRGRMILILRGKRLGFSLREIAEWLDLYDSDPGQVEQMRLTLNKARDRIETLEAQHRDLQQTLDELRSIASDVEDFLRSKGASTEAAE